MKVSILIPTHNSADWLRASISSALAQSEIDREVLVWDDGSTDGTAGVLASFEDRIRRFEGPARGGNYARNRLLDAAGGEWIQFLDADDYLEPDKIARQLQEAGSELDSANVLYSPVWVETWRDGRAGPRAASPVDAATDLVTQWLAWELPQTGGALWRRTSLLNLGGWREAQLCCQEHELYARALRAGRTFRFCPSPGAVYRIWSEQTVCRRDPLLVIREKTRLIDEMLDWLDANGRLTTQQRETAGQACFEMARTWARYDVAAAGDYVRARRKRGLIRAHGKAAPWTYRLAVKLLGFNLTESLLRVRRRFALGGLKS